MIGRGRMSARNISAAAFRMREIGLVIARKRDRLLPVSGFGAHLEPGPRQHLDEVEPDERLVFGDQDPHAYRL